MYLSKFSLYLSKTKSPEFESGLFELVVPRLEHQQNERPDVTGSEFLPHVVDERYLVLVVSTLAESTAKESTTTESLTVVESATTTIPVVGVVLT
jgi:hypothetical protein